jgi:hypothetical protein
MLGFLKFPSAKPVVRNANLTFKWASIVFLIAFIAVTASFVEMLDFDAARQLPERAPAIVPPEVNTSRCKATP